MTVTLPKDDPARQRIRDATDETLFVNAGAGSGKTTALIGRVRTLVLRDDIPLARIAAVTFTEKAGAELRDRLRAEFETAYRTEGVAAERARHALDDLDSAAIGTLHAFTQRILSEHPIEAALPPIIEVLDEVGSSVAFEERWAGLQAALLDDDAIAPALLLALAAGVKLAQLRSLTQLLTNDWDLLETHVLAGADPVFDPPDATDLIARFEALVARADECLDGTDNLLAKLTSLAPAVSQLRAARDLAGQLPAWKLLAEAKYGLGRKTSWPSGLKDDIAVEGKALSAAALEFRGTVAEQCLRVLTRWLARRVLADAESRRAEGRLEFHDLLVLARDLLRRDGDVRAAVHDDYQRVLLDEFQDTDPIQIEIAARICGGRAAAAPHWRDLEIPPGRLFVVGDAKQSIYRFRRASIRTYLEAREHLGGATALTTNFRTVPEVLDWVNLVFGNLIQPQPDRQPEYQPLVEHRDGGGTGPSVTLLGADGHADRPNAATMREREAADVAALVRQIIAEQWTVAGETDGHWRPARYEDIAILVPARTSLPFLTDALDTARVPYRAEASSLVYQAEEVRALFACARAIADATDALALVTALRSPLFGCGDDDLWTWKRDGGRFSIYADVDEAAAATPVGAALTYLRKLAVEARWLAPSEVLARIVADRRMLEVAATSRRARDEWRRLRFVVDQARAWSEVSHGGLRAYLAWASRQGLETTRVAEAVLPETDAASVRVLTIHAAKGLEFPIVIMSGMSSQPNTQRGVALLWTEAGYEVRTSKSVQTGAFEAVLPVDEQMDELERLRLLYVAATRARDHLVVSLHRNTQSSARTAAAAMAAVPGVRAGATSFVPPDEPADAPPPRAASVASPPDYATWIAGIEAARAASRHRAAITASGLEGTEPEIVLSRADDSDDAGLAKGPRDLELPPWTKGRYGSAVGRAVHAVLQTIDLDTGAGLDATVAAQVVAEGVAGHDDQVRALVLSALESEVVRAAAGSEHWRETYVGTVQADGVVLEGYLDLLYRDSDGTLHIVDYKTDAIPAGAIDSRVTYYRPQLEAYRTALVAATGAPVTTTLLFLNPAAPAVAVPVH